MGFGMMTSNTTKYYISHHSMGRIFVFDDNWNYISNKSSFNRAASIIAIGNFLYITGDSNIWKTDQELNILINQGCAYLCRGLYFNKTNNLIFVAPEYQQMIYVFNLNLTLIDRIYMSPHYPFSMNGFNNLLYVGVYEQILVTDYYNYITNRFNTCRYPRSINFDDYGNAAIGCDNHFYLYNTNGDYLNKNISIINSYYPLYFGFDSKSRLILVTSGEISLFF
jgi:hypothetical protein